MVCGDDERYLVELSTLLGISELRVVNYEVRRDSDVVFYCEVRAAWAPCPACKTKSSEVYDDSRQHTVRDAPVLGKRCSLEFSIRRFWCEVCQKSFTESLGFIKTVGVTVRRKNSRRTVRYEAYVYELCRQNTISHVAHLEGLGYSLVKRIYYETTKSKLKLRTTDPLRVLGIDEISQKKGHKDKLGVLYNIEAGIVWDVFPGRPKGTGENYLKGLSKRVRNGIEVGTVGMWKNNRLAMGAKLPEGLIGVDPFYVL